MKKLLYIIFFICNSSFAQTAIDFLANDIEKIENVKITDIITEGKKYGYSLIRNEVGQFIFTDGFQEFFYLEKKINDNNLEKFPNYSVGNITKKYYTRFKDIRVDYPLKIETIISLIEYDNVKKSQIDNYYVDLKKELSEILKKHNYKIKKTTNKLDFNISGKKYDIVEELKIEKPCPKSKKENNKDCLLNINFLNSSYIESGKGQNTGNILYYNNFIFTSEDADFSKTFTYYDDVISSYNKTFEKIKFTMGGKDLREINQYDLEAMIKYFLEDCQSNNIKILESYSINATFEPLEGNLIALSYASGNDTLIKIKVDPEKWAKSSIEKRWYVLYHELGHDVLNLDHGQGGKMMFNFADKEYSWDDFFVDKAYMYNYINR
jgi:hypothetical protein